MQDKIITVLVFNVLILGGVNFCSSSSNKSAGPGAAVGNTGIGTATQTSTVTSTGTSGQGSGSTVSTMCEIAATHSCIENNNVASSDTSSASSTCTQQQGVFVSNATCLRTGAVGGCLQSGALGAGVTRVIAWQYSPVTADQVKNTCAAAGQTFVTTSDVPAYGTETDATIFAMCMVSAASNCYEYSNLPAANVAAALEACNNLHGSFAPKANCSKSNAVGACTQSGPLASGTTMLLLWYYSPTFNKEQVMQICPAAHETFVAPVTVN